MSGRRRFPSRLGSTLALILAVGSASTALSVTTAPPAAAAAPIAFDDSLLVVTDQPTPLSLNAGDDDADPLTYLILLPPAHGTLSDCSDGTCTYTPDNGYVGNDAFTWRASDGTSQSATATMALTVEPPSASIESAGPLTRIEVSPQLNCAVNHDGDSQGAFYGDTACGTFAVVDGTLYGPRQVPGASIGRAYTPVAQSAVTGSGTLSQPFRITTTVALGSTGVQLVQTDTYIVGQESFRTDVQIKNSATPRSVRVYRAGDCYIADSDTGLGAVDAGAVSCVSPVSSRIEQFLPLSSGSRYFEGTYQEMWSLISAKSPLPNSCRCTELVDNGAALQWDVSLGAGANATRSSVITFSPLGALPLGTGLRVNDGYISYGESTTFTITVNNPGQVAAAVTELYATLPAGFTYTSGSTTGATTAEPTLDGATLHWSTGLTLAPSSSISLSFTVQAPSVSGIYLTNAGATATDLFVNESGETAPVKVTSGVGNDAPVANPDSATTAEDSAVTIPVLANDTDLDGDTLTATATGSAGGGTWTCSTTCTYTPAPNVTGTVSLTYQVDDGHGGTANGSVSVTITPVNDAPTPANDTVTAVEDTATTWNVLDNDTDPDGDALTITGRTSPAHGTVTCTSTCRYTPNADYFGADTFTYTVLDPSGATATATVTVTVTGTNDAPTAVADTLSGDEDQPITFSMTDLFANDLDPDQDPLSLAYLGAPVHGELTCLGYACSYQPPADYHGPDSFGYGVTDGLPNQSLTTVTITINPVNDAPDAADDTASAYADFDTTIAVLGNDSDVDGDSLTVSVDAAPQHGTVSCATTCRYRSEAGFTGTDTFTYLATDPSGATSQASVTVSVSAAPSTDLSLTLTTTTATKVAVGNELGWSVQVTNQGTVGSAPYTVELPLNRGFRVRSTSVPCTQANALLTCSMAGLAAGAKHTITVRGAFTVAGSAPVQPTAAVPGDPNTANNAPTRTLTVTGKTCTVIGTFLSDRLTGTTGTDVICGFSGNDTVSSNGGNDTLYGNDGNDRLDGATGNDLLDGGPGIDTAVFSGTALAVKASLATKRATGQGTDTLTAVENLEGSSRADLLTGDTGANQLNGAGGNDTLNGGAGNDALLGGAGLDALFGGTGNDRLDGGTSKDRCVQGTGRGTLISCERRS